jgi:NADPH:quinone reductase
MLPTEMNVVDIVNAGPEGRLEFARHPVPNPRASEVLIEVHAAGVNGADLKQRKGLYPGQERASSVPGLEVSGVIVRAAPRSTSGLSAIRSAPSSSVAATRSIA